MAGRSGHETEATVTLCNALWGPKLTFQREQDVVSFNNLLPSASELVETYREAKLQFASYELVALLLVTNSSEHLIALLDAKILEDNQRFSFADNNNFTLTHLACAVGARDVVTRLSQDGRVFNSRDHDGHTPTSVCFSSNVRGALPARRTLFRKPLVEQPLRAVKKKEIFELAKISTNFYKLIIELQKHTFDVNLEQNESGDLMVHVATSGGLPSLPLLLFLVNNMKANINTHNNKGLTPLCLACSYGFVKMAEVMICVLGADINITDSYGRTPLHYAAKFGHARTVSMLLRRGVDAGREDHSKRIAEMLAWQRKELECVQLIRKHSEERCSKLCEEIISNQLDVASLFPSDYCTINKDGGYTLLMIAVLHNQKELVQQLVSHDQCPRNFVHYPSKKTAVTMAAELCNVECLKSLLDAGCCPYVMDEKYRLPIHYAAAKGNALCVELITRLKSNDGLKGLYLARQLAGDNKEIIKLLDDAQLRRQEQIVTPHLFQASIYGDKDGTLYYLLEDGDDMNPSNQDGDWPLLVATRHGQYHIVKLLCERGGHVIQKQPITKEMPLHFAAKAGQIDMVALLLKFGASSAIDEVTSSGVTPLELSANHGHAKVVELLLEYGASTALPDSSANSLLQAPNYPGVQLRLDVHRTTITDEIIQALKRRVTLREFQSIWKGPHYHNYRDRYGNTMVMVAVSSNSRYEILEFLLESADSCHDNLFVTSANTINNGLEDSGIPFDNTDDLPRPASTNFLEKQSSYVLLEKRSLSVVPEHFTVDDKVDHMMPCKNILKLVSAHNGQTALHEAVKVNNISAVKLLLQYDKSCADIQDHHGDTPLHLACKQHKVNHRIIQELMECTNLSLHNNDHKMAEDLCLSEKLRNEITAQRDNQKKDNQQTDSLGLPPSPTDTNPYDPNREPVGNQRTEPDEHLKQLGQ